MTSHRNGKKILSEQQDKNKDFRGQALKVVYINGLFPKEKKKLIFVFSSLTSIFFYAIIFFDENQKKGYKRGKLQIKKINAWDLTASSTFG
jgi:hypothetical protein